MNYAAIAVATCSATVVYFMLGGLLFAVSPLKDEFRKYPAVYRTQEDMKGVWPIGIAGMIVSIAAVTCLYAASYRGGPGWIEGAKFGALIGLFVVGGFVLHNHVNLNIGLRLTLGQALAYWVEWLLVGIVIGLVYKPAGL